MTAIDIRPADTDPIRIGVSSCVIGEEVRWNGGHSRQRYLTDMLGPFVEYVPAEGGVCANPLGFSESRLLLAHIFTGPGNRCSFYGGTICSQPVGLLDQF